MKTIWWILLGIGGLLMIYYPQLWSFSKSALWGFCIGFIGGVLISIDQIIDTLVEHYLDEPLGLIGYPFVCGTVFAIIGKFIGDGGLL